MLPMLKVHALRALFLALLVGGVDARAAGNVTVDRCISASELGQTLRDQGQLLEARGQFVACAHSACPAAIRGECTKWLAGVDTRIPTIAVRAQDPKGEDLLDVRVFVDGKLAKERLDGRSIPVNPGDHRLRVEYEDAKPVELRILAREGEQNRLIDVTLSSGDDAAPPDVPATPPVTSSPPGPTTSPVTPPLPPPAQSWSIAQVPTGVWVLGGVGLVGAGTFAYYGNRGKSAVDEMRETCAPRCARSRVDDAQRDATIANVALGLGLTALATAGVWIVLGIPSSKSSQPSQPPARDPAWEVGLGVQVIPGGHMTTLRAAFF